MTSPALRSRALLLLLILIHAVWMYSIGHLFGVQFRREVWPPNMGVFLVAACLAALIALVRSFVFSRWPDFMRNARCGMSRTFVLLEFAAAASLLIGFHRGYGVHASGALAETVENPT